MKEGRMEVHARFLDGGRWTVNVVTRENEIEIGSVSVTRAGQFRPQRPSGPELGLHQHLVRAASALAGAELGPEGLRLGVKLPFADGSGP